MRVWENGNRRVDGDMDFIDYEDYLSYQLYEDERRVMSILVLEKNFTDSNSEKCKRVYDFLNSFLEHGIENMTISDIYDSFKDVKCLDGNVTLYLKNGMKYEYERGFYRYSCTLYEQLFFEINGKRYGAKLLNRDITYHELSTLTTANVLDYIDVVYIPNRVNSFDFFMKGFDASIEDYGFEIPTYPDVVERICNIKNLKKTDFFNTGHLFKITKEVKCEFAKRKLLKEELPALLAVDSNGYGIFDGVSHIVTK